jgi:hypothetical protein
MKFNNLNDLLNYRRNCPFCLTPLKATVETFWSENANYSVKHSEITTNTITFDLFDFCNFFVSISLQDDVVQWHHKHMMTSNVSFPIVFNGGRIYIAQSCINIYCQYHYVLASVALRMDYDTSQIKKTSFSYETFRSQDYQCCNSYIRNNFSIWHIEKSSNVITHDFYELNSHTTKNIDSRIKTLIIFS